MGQWTKADMPPQNGKTVIVTGANTGLGYETALALSQAGAEVILACRNLSNAEKAIENIRASGVTGTLVAIELDLADLNAVSDFAETVFGRYSKVDILVNNAGIMYPPAGKTKDGFETQFGVNFLGHFKLTGLLYNLLSASSSARVINLSSGAHKRVDTIDFGNLKLEKQYDPVREYAVSKLADLVFTLQLQKRIDIRGDKVISVGAHPGITRTDLQRHIPATEIAQRMGAYPVVMEPWQGALPELFAATAKEIIRGGYYGPDGENELSGYPAPAIIGAAVRNEMLGNKLWEFAEEVTGIQFP